MTERTVRGSGLCLPLLTALLSAGLGFSQTNLLLNPGFEDWVGGQPDYWDVQSGITVTQEWDTVHGGDYSAQVDYPQGQSGSRRLRQAVAVNAGQDYLGSFWVYDNEEEVRSRIWISWRDADSNHISGVGSPYSVDQEGWQQLWTGIEAAPDSAVTAWFDLRVYPTDSLGGTLHLDDAYFGAPVGVEEHGQSLPSPLSLTLRSFPNPAWSRICVVFTLPDPSQVDLAVYDKMGRRLSTLLEGKGSGAYNSAWWDLPAGMSSGYYFLKLRASGQSRVAKIGVLR